MNIFVDVELMALMTIHLADWGYNYYILYKIKKTPQLA